MRAQAEASLQECEQHRAGAERSSATLKKQLADAQGALEGLTFEREEARAKLDEAQGQLGALQQQVGPSSRHASGCVLDSRNLCSV